MIDPDELAEREWKWDRAIWEYLAFHDRAAFERLLLSDENPPPLARQRIAKLVFGDLKRPSGRPPKIRHSDREVVQLVYNARLLSAAGFSNSAGDAGNDAFRHVAALLGVSEKQVRDAYYRVDHGARHQIRDFLKAVIDGRNPFSEK